MHATQVVRAAQEAMRTGVLAVLLLAAHMRWSADAFGLHALPACRGLDAGLHGDRGRRLCVLGPLRTLLQTPGRARRRSWGKIFALRIRCLLPCPLSSLPTLRLRCLGLLSPCGCTLYFAWACFASCVLRLWRFPRRAMKMFTLTPGLRLSAGSDGTLPPPDEPVVSP